MGGFDHIYIAYARSRLRCAILVVVSLWLAFATLPLAAGDAIAASGKSAKQEPITQVYFIRGFLGIFSTGFDKMAGDVSTKRIKAEVHSHLSSSSIYAKIVKQHGKSKRRRKKLVLVGHSFGGNAAFSVANKLRKDNIKVDLVVTVDPTRSGPLSTNVRRYINYYFPGNGLGAKLKSGKIPAKRIKNIDMRTRADISGKGDDHWTVTNNAAVKRELLRAIKRALR